MKNIVLIAALAAVFLSAPASVLAQNRSIQFFEGTWQEAKNKAEAEGKLLFVDIYASWCPPCRWMERHVFTNDSVADFYNQNFVCYKIDVEKSEERWMADKYNVEYLPTFLFLIADGRMINSHRMKTKPAKFLQLGLETSQIKKD